MAAGMDLDAWMGNFVVDHYAHTLGTTHHNLQLQVLTQWGEKRIQQYTRLVQHIQVMLTRIDDAATQNYQAQKKAGIYHTFQARAKARLFTP